MVRPLSEWALSAGPLASIQPIISTQASSAPLKTTSGANSDSVIGPMASMS